MSFTPYEIDTDLTVKVYLQGQEHPWVLQPNHPEDRPWVDRAEAEAFAEEYAAIAADVYAKQQIAAAEETPSV